MLFGTTVAKDLLMREVFMTNSDNLIYIARTITDENYLLAIN